MGSAWELARASGSSRGVGGGGVGAGLGVVPISITPWLGTSVSKRSTGVGVVSISVGVRGISSRFGVGLPATVGKLLRDGLGVIISRPLILA